MIGVRLGHRIGGARRTGGTAGAGGSRGAAVLPLQLGQLFLVVSLQGGQLTVVLGIFDSAVVVQLLQLPVVILLQLTELGAQAVRRIILFGQLLLQSCQLLLIVGLQICQTALVFSALGFALIGVGVLQLLQLLVITLFQIADLVGKLIRTGRAGAGGTAAGAGVVLFRLVLGDQLCKRLLVFYAQQLLSRSDIWMTFWASLICFSSSASRAALVVVFFSSCADASLYRASSTFFSRSARSCS